MALTARIQDGGQVTIPARVRQRAGLSKGAVLEIAVSKGRIILTPQTAKPSPSPEEPSRRAAVEAGMSDLSAGRVSRRFKSADDMLVALAGRATKQRAK